ncbi:MAG: ferrous iron transport protein B [Planctomycetes bacterium]|nr:ferrous iron transport protein B [Planctomycetota bacterium]
MACHDDKPARPGRKDGALTVALAGNPNSGKTTIFNNLTGAHQHVANYPGVTVERKEGECTHCGRRLHVVDLPGTYSLTPYSIEEVVARNFLIEERPDAVVDVVDASNLERNLYLAVQLLELRVPLVLALNMSDLAERRGFAINHRHLSELLGATIVPTVGHKGKGTPELLDAIVAVAEGRGLPRPVEVTYGREVDEELAKLVPLVEAVPGLSNHHPPRWVAVKLLEDDSLIRESIERLGDGARPLLDAAAASRRHLQTVFGDSPEIVIADRTYGFISGACEEAVTRTVEARHTMSDRIDRVVMHSALGIPTFLLLTYLVFQFTFTVGEAPTGWVESFFGWLSQSLAHLWPKGAESPLRSLLCDGVIGGVGGVLVFVPYIILLFLAIAVLEDTGYMARAAFIMDRVMHKIGLHGKSFIPMLVGFGCNVPAIMATRTLDTRRDRLATIMVLPLMSCSARLVVYTVLVGAFFPNRVLVDLGFMAVRTQPLILFSLYALGVLLAIAGAKLLRATALRGETLPLVIELPPYRVPTLRGLAIHVWERSRLYIKKAGTIILGVAIALWVLTTYPKKQRYAEDYEARGRAAAEAYARSMRELAEPLGLPAAHAGQLEALARADLALAEARENHFEHEAGHKEAVARHERALAELRAGPAGARIASFLQVRQTIEEARGRFDQAMQRYNPPDHSPAHVSLLRHLEDDLAKPRSSDAAAYAAASAYLDKALPAYEGELEAIRNGQAAEDIAHSMAGRIGRLIEPLIRPLGFDWKIGTGLLGAFGAREVFVAQMGIIYAVGSGEEHVEALRERLRAEYTPLVGFCIMLFFLISLLCVPTTVITRRETGSWGWALAQLGGLTALAYILTLVTYQLGRILGA